jgi:hypothetical protein
MYLQKYNKYKNKYLTLKKLFGGTKEENNQYILHGTSLFYIDDIIKNGLTGQYNRDLYTIIKKYWDEPEIQAISLKSDSYVSNFIARQENVKSSIKISFTGKIDVAREYSTGVRKFGEGPSRFLRAFNTFIINMKIYIKYLVHIKITS